jgi:hypothetical protein
MARSSLQITVDQKTPLNLENKSGRQLLRKVIRHLEGVLGGSVDASHVRIQVDGAQPVAASATITMNAANVADTCTINGVDFTASNGGAGTNEWDQSGNATAEAVSLAAAINGTASALVAKHVEASNWAGSVALSTCIAGTVISINGHRLTARATAAQVRDVGDFTIVGDNTADGDKLVLAINGHPILSHDLVASNSSGTVTIRQRRGTSAYGRIVVTDNPNVASGGASGVTATQFASTAVVLVSAKHPDQTGNTITLAESTSGARLAVSAARLSGGTGAASGTAVTVICGGSAQ